MLSYRHAFHAGNHADVFKHLVLVQVLNHLNQKDKPWWYVDTHAGAGVYDLGSNYARKNSEHDSGIGRLWSRSDTPQSVADYLALVRGMNPDGHPRLYPGSPWIASRLMRPRDRLRLFELHPTDLDLLRRSFAEMSRQVRIVGADGFAGLKTVLPPPPRRGFILIDPAYEVKTDYRQVIAALKAGLERFATGIYAVWYPMLPRQEARELPDRLKRLPGLRWLHVGLAVRAPTPEGHGMHGSGLFLVNPPWPLAETLRAILPWLAEALAQDDKAGFLLEEQVG